MNDARPILLITGMGTGLGASLASAFAGAGYDVLGISRSTRAARQVDRLVAEAGGTYTHLCCDLTRSADVATALNPHADRVAVAIHNAHTLVIKPFDQIDAMEFENAWRVSCLAAAVVAQLVLPGMKAAGRGSIVLTGATAGLRGSAKFAAFASAKFALRGLAQSLAREYGPLGIHIAHVVIDGLIDAPQTNERFGPARTARMDADAIARSYLNLVHQSASSWTHELDLRPFTGTY